MGIYKFMAVVIVLAMLIIPLGALEVSHGKGTSDTQITQPKNDNSKEENPETVKVFMRKEEVVLNITAQEYIVGVLAAEMLPTYHEQALKAQAVAAYTYLLHKKSESEKSPDASLKGAYLSDDSSTHQGYMTFEERSEKWGEKSEQYEKKLQKAVEAVLGKVITFDGKPIIAAFHANNSGVTHSAKTVWGGDVPYLQSVVSVGDKLSPDCVKTVAISSQEFSSLAGALDGCNLNGEASDWIGDVKADENGYVKSIIIGGGEFTGLRVRDALGLRSAVFTYDYKDGTFRFTTEGYGHGVGMSQYGADYMARQGSKWEEIIKHYYTGVEIV